MNGEGADDEWPAGIAGVGDQMYVGLGGLLQLLPLDLPVGRAPGRFPFVGIDAAVLMAVKNRHPTWIALPAFQQFRDFSSGVGRFPQAADGAEQTDDVQLLAGQNALLGKAASGPDPPEGVNARAAGAAVPHIAPGLDKVGPFGIDHATSGAVVQGEQVVAVAGFDRPPTPAGGPFLDSIAIPGAGQTAERGHDWRSRQEARPTVQFHVTLWGRANAGDGRVGQPPCPAAEM